MKSVVGRRVFVGSVVAGLPLIAGVGARTLAQSRGQGTPHVHPADAASDPVVDHLLRELAAIHNRTRRQFRGEDARAFAAQMRTLVVYARQQNLDGHIKAAARGTVERDGRQAVLWRDPDPASMRAELGRYGVEIDPRVKQFVAPPDFTQRSEALDTLLRDGITGSWERTARLLERAAPELDRRAGPALRVAVAQTDEAWKQAFCAQLWSEYTAAQTIAAAQCALVGAPWVGEYFSVACFAAEMAALTLLGVYHAYC